MKRGRWLRERLEPGPQFLSLRTVPVSGGTHTLATLTEIPSGRILAAGIKDNRIPTCCETCERVIGQGENCFGTGGKVYCEDCGLPA